MYTVKAKLLEIGRFERIDPVTGVTRVDKSYRIQVDHYDGTRTNETIYFPRDFKGQRYQEPEMIAEEFYSFPITQRISKDGKKISMTARPDLLPKPANK
ncbi:MAG: hypothetical protein ABL893_04770 [Hyphomicrobium sp.]